MMKNKPAFHLVLILLMSVSCYERYQQEIPNGEIVPHPCKQNFLWRGVGHMSELGGDSRNQFGLDFKANGFKWDSNLCKKDSDGDGKTNGEELGDPDCIWRKGKQPSRNTGLSHPGICDPVDNPLCHGKHDFVNCDQEDFHCPAIHEPEVFNFTVAIPETDIPANVTTYTCLVFEFPRDANHVIAYKPMVNNIQMLHHILVFHCEDDTEVSDEPYVCGMTPGPKCVGIISVWSVGLAGVCPHEGSGMLVGGTWGIKKAAIQLHWNNPEKKANEIDSSGMIFYVTPKLRPYNSGMMMIGQTYLEIPPKQERYSVLGGCPAECSALIITNNITVVSAVNHMHYLGRSQMTEVWRDGKFVADLATDNYYSYDHPLLHNSEHGIIVKPGDEIRTTCVYKTTSRETTTYYGEHTTDEMCFAFISYFPVENAKPKCNSWRGSSTCDWKENNNVVYGCDFRTLTLDDPEMLQIYSNVTEKCVPGNCKIECMLIVRNIKKKPCFLGDADKYARFLAFKGEPESAKYKMMSEFYAALDSCDKDMLEEQILKLKTKLRIKENEGRQNCSQMKYANKCEVNRAGTILFNCHFLTVVIVMVFCHFFVTELS